MATRSTDRPAAGRRTRPGIPAAQTPARSGAAIDPALAAELAGPPWEAMWELTPTLHTPVADPGARQRLWTLAEMIRPAIRDALVMSQHPRALDLRCGEGWIAQRLLAWGAERVVAVDPRPEMLHRARLLREHFAIRPVELDLLAERDWGPPPHENRFDVAVLTGSPGAAGAERELARARAAARAVCALECRGDDADRVAKAALAAGFTSVERVRPPLHGAPEYVTERRNVLIARVAMGR